MRRLRNWAPCARDGHGPTVFPRRRIWWAPWRKRTTAVCWVCYAPLNAEQSRRADEQWLHLFKERPKS